MTVAQSCDADTQGLWRFTNLRINEGLQQQCQSDEKFHIVKLRCQFSPVSA
jgi:hypothetical protein